MGPSFWSNMQLFQSPHKFQRQVFSSMSGLEEGISNVPQLRNKSVVLLFKTLHVLMVSQAGKEPRILADFFAVDICCFSLPSVPLEKPPPSCHAACGAINKCMLLVRGMVKRPTLSQPQDLPFIHMLCPRRVGSIGHKRGPIRIHTWLVCMDLGKVNALFLPRFQS